MVGKGDFIHKEEVGLGPFLFCIKEYSQFN